MSRFAAWFGALPDVEKLFFLFVGCIVAWGLSTATSNDDMPTP